MNYSTLAPRPKPYFKGITAVCNEETMRLSPAPEAALTMLRLQLGIRDRHKIAVLRTPLGIKTWS